MFYLKYRPHTLAEVDNVIVKDTLIHILKSKQIPHALLLVGPKGTGKTSTARILAMSINCLNNAFSGKGESIEPCNSCANCKSIENSSSPDVTEMDAASNRGIDEVRTLIHDASFSPIAGKYRVFIIDEAHMITSEAFNALLKTLEEPPASVVFILATTNEEKVPRTIISRCHKVVFGKAKIEDIVHMLKRIAKEEKIVLSEEILQLIARHADDSFRDAAKLFEELHVQGKLDTVHAQEYLGIRAKGTLITTLETQPLDKTLAWVALFSESGGSVKYLVEDSLKELHRILLQSHNIPSEEPEIKTTLSPQRITSLMRLLQEAYINLKYAPVETIPLEIAVVEFYNKQK